MQNFAGFIQPLPSRSAAGNSLPIATIKNPQAKATLVLLTGGIGLSDLFYKHFARFARDFSVLTFDYQLQFGDNGEFADAVAELLRPPERKGLAGGTVPGRRSGPRSSPPATRKWWRGWSSPTPARCPAT